jgi:hypothetical protein
MGWVVTLRPLYPLERPGTNFIGGWVGLRAGLDGCGKSHLHRDLIPGPSSPYRVAMPTELPWPTKLNRKGPKFFSIAGRFHLVQEL